MKKIFFTIILVGFLAFLLPIAASAMEYQHILEAKEMQFSWSIDDKNIHIMISAKTTSWVAIGFEPENAMQGANIVIGYIKNGTPKIEDHYGIRKTGHTSDKKLGGTDDVINPSGQEEGGVTTISFTLPLITEDKWDKPIKPSGTTRIILAHGQGRDSFSSVHPFRTVYDIDLSTGESKKIK